MQIECMTRAHAESVIDMMRTFYASPAVSTNGSEAIFRADVEECLGASPYLEGYVFTEGETLVGYGMLAKSFSTEFGKPCIWIEDLYLKEDARKRLGGFSGGMRQRVLLAQALLGQPKILILDEPTAGLDPKERLRLRQYIGALAENRIVFLTTHIVTDLESIATEVLLMKDGALVKHGVPEELIYAVDGKDLEDVYMAYLGGD